MDTLISFLLFPFEVIGEPGVVSKFVGILLLLVYAMVIWLVGWGLFVAADSWWMPRQTGIGVITGKCFTPAHTTTTFIMINGVMTPMVNSIPDDYSLGVDVADGHDSVSVSCGFYAIVTEGDRVNIEFVQGRISGNVYIKSISK